MRINSPLITQPLNDQNNQTLLSIFDPLILLDRTAATKERALPTIPLEETLPLLLLRVTLEWSDS